MLQLQSLSFVAVHPAGQQLSLETHMVTGVPLHVPLLHWLLVMHVLGFVHGMPLLAGWPPPQVPAMQVSPLRQMLIVEQAVPSGAFCTWHEWVELLHWLSWHGLVLGGHVLGVPVHVPFMHVSFITQNCPSLHGVPLGLAVFTQPIMASQLPVLQRSVRKLQLVGVVPMQVPPEQTPLLKQRSFTGVQVAPSLPAMLLHFWAVSSHMPTVQSPTGGHVLGVPMQAPIEHTSLSVQKRPSSQVAPSLAGVFTQKLLKHAPSLHASARTEQSLWWRQGTGPSGAPPSAPAAPPLPLLVPTTVVPVVPVVPPPPAATITVPCAHEPPATQATNPQAKNIDQELRMGHP
jgi:hypothetical protein